MASTTQSVTISTPQDGVSTYKVTYSYSGGTYYVVITGTNPYVSVDAGGATADEAIASASRLLDNWGLPGYAQNDAGKQLSQNVSENGQAAFASISPTVPPASDPVAADAQAAADATSGAADTPTEGTTAPDVPASDPAAAQATATDAGATVTPTQGTTPEDIPPDPQGNDPFLEPDVVLPDDGQDTDSFLGDTNAGAQGEENNARQQATLQDATNFALGQDWRVRLALAPGASYLYKVAPGQAGILNPLQATDGVIFPYTPDIQVTYVGNYEPLALTHSNYKIFQYQSSSVDQVSISCPFTAQDTTEAAYMLAVIHFFRSATKMFYGQDQTPIAGIPPPLCYLFGLGAFQFDNHPLVIGSFTYSLPTDVDYIRVSTATVQPGVGSANGNNDGFNPNPAQQAALQRLGGTIKPGGQPPPAYMGPPPVGTVAPTYVPTMMNMQITCYPIVSRNDISNNFSLRDYATGQLTTRGIW